VLVHNVVYSEAKNCVNHLTQAQRTKNKKMCRVCPTCCPNRGEAALLVSIYSAAVSVSLLAVLGLRGHDFGPGVSTLTTELLHHVCLAVYAVSLTTSLLLFLGLLLPLRPLLLPWLGAHAILCLCLVVASLNYLVLYTQVDCNNNACTILLGLSAVLVVAVLVLLYCLYVVQDWLDMLTHDQGVKKKLAAMDPSGRGRRGEPGAGAPSTVSPTSQPGRTMEVTANSTSTTLASPAHLPSSLAPQGTSTMPKPSAPPPSSSSMDSSQRSRPLPKTVITRQPITGAPIPQTSL